MEDDAHSNRKIKSCDTSVLPRKKKRRKESEDKITSEMIKETTPYAKDSESFTTSRDCHVTYRSPIRSTILFYICYTC